MPDDEVIKEYLISHNVAYFDILYRRYSGKVFGKCLSILKEENSAEDAMQDIFMKVLLNLSKFSGKSKFSTWLYSITYNFCIDTVRRAKKKKHVLVDDFSKEHDSAADDIEDKFLLETKISKLKIIMEELPATDKAILMMKYQDDMSIREIGGILEKSESAIKMKIKRAKQKFQKIHYERFKKETV
jgi:RNA polymerase sigma-70 factor (ECF subfamily)